MRQAGQIEAISQTKGTSSNIGQNGRRRKDYFGGGGKFVSYVKLLCKPRYVNLVDRRIRSSLFGSKRARYGAGRSGFGPYLACTRDYDSYSPLSRKFLPQRHFRDFHHAAPAGLFPPDRLSDRRSGVPALFSGSAPQQPRRTGAARRKSLFPITSSPLVPMSKKTLIPSFLYNSVSIIPLMMSPPR